MICLKINGKEIGDPELALQIFAMRRRVDKAADSVGKVKPLERGMFEVSSQSSKEVYVVDLWGGSCTCADWQFRAQQCKHQIAAKLMQDRLESKIKHDYGQVY